MSRWCWSSCTGSRRESRYTHPQFSLIAVWSYVYSWGPLSFTSSVTYSLHLPHDLTFTFPSFLPTPPLPLPTLPTHIHTRNLVPDQVNAVIYHHQKNQREPCRKPGHGLHSFRGVGITLALLSPWQQHRQDTQILAV